MSGDSSFHTGWLNAFDELVVALNIVYDASQFTLQQVQAAMKPKLDQLKATFGTIAISFDVTYRAGKVNSERTRIARGSMIGRINVFYFHDSKNIYSYAKTTGYNHILMSESGGSLRNGSLAHEVGHVLGIKGHLYATAEEYLPSYLKGDATDFITLTIDNVTSDININTSILWMDNGLAAFGRDWVDDYRTATTTSRTLLNAWSVAKIGATPSYGTSVRPRTPTVLDIYRVGARSFLAK